MRFWGIALSVFVVYGLNPIDIAHADETTATKSLIVQVGYAESATTAHTEALAQLICDTVGSVIEDNTKYQEILCLAKSALGDKYLEDAKKSAKYSFVLRITSQRDQAWTLSAENLKRADETDFEFLEWTIHPDEVGPKLRSPMPIRLTKTTMTQKEALQRILLRFLSFDDQKKNFRKWVLSEVANGTSQTIGYDKNKGTFFDKTTQVDIPTATAYDFYRNESLKQRSFLRVVEELGVLYGIEGTVYYTSPAAQDFDYDWDVAGKMIFHKEKWRMDDNNWFLNQIGHPITGLWVQQMARNNGFGPLESFLVGLTTSTIWEVLIEYRERISINDLIMTPVAGSIMGEVLYQFQSAFSSGRSSVITRVLGGFLGGPQYLGKLLHGKRPLKSESLTKYGFADDFPRSLDFTLGAYSDGNLRGDIQGEIIKVDDYGQAGKAHEVLTDVPLAEMLLEAGIDERGRSDFYWYFKTALRAIHKKRIELDAEGKPRGFEMLLAPSYSYRMEIIGTQKDPTPKDMLASASLIGGTTDVTFFMGDTTVRVVLDGYGDFSAIRSLAFVKYSATHETKGVPDILYAENYYFGFGTRHAARINVKKDFRKGSVDLGLRTERLHVYSINGLSRWQEGVTNDFSNKDQRTTADAWIGYRPLQKDWMHLSAGITSRNWDSRIDQLQMRQTAGRHQFYTKVKFAF